MQVRLRYTRQDDAPEIINAEVSATDGQPHSESVSGLAGSYLRHRGGGHVTLFVPVDAQAEDAHPDEWVPYASFSYEMHDDERTFSEIALRAYEITPALA